MSERDELRVRLLSLGGSISAGWRGLDVADQFDQEKAEAVVDATMEVILAAGYRKPRTITTAEELDALPNGTVVIATLTSHHSGGWPLAYQRWEDGEWHRGARSAGTHPDYIIPATVLHEGAQS